MTDHDKNNRIANKAETVEQAALDLCKPPFRFSHGYIFDGGGEMFSDSGGLDEQEEKKEMMISRVRGWGRLGYLKGKFKPEDVQDEIGKHIAKALTEYWEKYNGQ